MSELRRRFVEHLELKGFSKATVRNYVDVVAQMSRFIKHSPARLTTEEIGAYLLHLKRVRKLQARTINLHMYAIRSFCQMQFHGGELMSSFGRMKEPDVQPVVLSRQDVERVIAAGANIRDQALICLMYSSGIRLSECTHLKIADIDSGRMVVHVTQGKGGKDRNALLSTRALQMLRDYYRKYRPKQWLFESRKTGGALHHRRVHDIVRQAAVRSGIGKRAAPHILRHSFATHLLEQGVALQLIQHLLGHADISTTAMYTHVSTELLHSVKSPLDTPLPQQPAPTVRRSRGRPRKKPLDTNTQEAA
jgi:site-specific recombinase XerD